MDKVLTRLGKLRMHVNCIQGLDFHCCLNIRTLRACAVKEILKCLCYIIQENFKSIAVCLHFKVNRLADSQKDSCRCMIPAHFYMRYEIT